MIAKNFFLLSYGMLFACGKFHTAPHARSSAYGEGREVWFLRVRPARMRRSDWERTRLACALLLRATAGGGLAFGGYCWRSSGLWG